METKWESLISPGGKREERDRLHWRFDAGSAAPTERVFWLVDAAFQMVLSSGIHGAGLGKVLGVC